MNRKIIGLVCWGLMCCVLPALAQEDSVFQYSTIDALLAGMYDGEMSCSQLSQKGNYGIGTFNALDGELILAQGIVYQIRMDGKAYPVGEDVMTPFATAAFFDADIASSFSGEKMSFEDFLAYLDSRFENPNFFYAVKIEGFFPYVKVRSVPAQEKPYRPLAEVVKDQAVFEHKDVKGTLIGFFTPEYAKGLNVPGYHFHFILEDRSQGGHVLDLVLSDAAVEIDVIRDFVMRLPDGAAFAAVDLTQDRAQELHAVEK